MSQDDWTTTTHHWDRPVDEAHLAEIIRSPATYAPDARHLVLEVLAYADDEAAARGRRGHAEVVLHPDASIEVRDDGRGTDTRLGADGRWVRKPVMATADVRYFGGDHEVHLPDGHLRRGMSVVAALCARLTHVNHRGGASWQQSYEHGVPLDGLETVAKRSATGTTVRFWVDERLVPPLRVHPSSLAVTEAFAHLDVEVRRAR